MCPEKSQHALHRIWRPLRVVISFAIRDIFRLSSVGLKVPLSVVHRNQIVINGVNEESRNGALCGGLGRVQRVQVETSRRLAYLHADLGPHHLHDRIRGHPRHHLSNHTGCYFFENTERTVNDQTRDRYWGGCMVEPKRSRATHTSPPQSDLRSATFLRQVVQHCSQVICLFPAESDPVSL